MTTTTITITTTKIPGGSCGSPKFANDIYCDDENNNAGCNFDGGACCNRYTSKWNQYCTDCQCLEVKNCKAIGIWSSFPNMDKWCNDNCNHSPPYCPATHCSCAWIKLFRRRVALATTRRLSILPLSCRLVSSSSSLSPFSAFSKVKMTKHAFKVL